MKNLMVANFVPGSRASFKDLETAMLAQVENSLQFGWKEEDIILLTNFAYKIEDTEIKAIPIPMNNFCLTGSKMFAMQWYYSQPDATDEVIWAHDLDLWQNHEMEEPKFKDVGIATYSRPKFNGGCVFYRKAAIDMIDAVVEDISANKEAKEEPTINKLWRTGEYKDRVTVVDQTYNVGCSGYKVRYDKSKKPLRGLHFHPTNRIAWDTHARNRNGISKDATISDRLRDLFKKYYDDRISKYVYEDKEDRTPYEVRPGGIDRKKSEKMGIN